MDNMDNIENKKNLTIVFCLPGKHFTNNFLLAWSKLLSWCLYNNIKPLIVNRTNSNVYYVRNSCLGGGTLLGKNQKPFNNEINYDYIMWIDSDQVFTEHDFTNLLTSNENIVSGLYLMENGSMFATVPVYDDKYFNEFGTYEFLTKEQLDIIKSPNTINNSKYKDLIKKDNTNLLEVSYTGFGFMLIKKGVFESLEYPWFRPLWKEIDENIHEFMSEDVSICELFKKKNYKIYVNINVVVGHEKSLIIN